MSDRCYYIKHGKEWVFIPGCMGGAALGPTHCTCLSIEEKLNAAIKRLEILSTRIEAAELWIEQHSEDGEAHPVVALIAHRQNKTKFQKPIAITTENPK